MVYEMNRWHSKHLHLEQNLCIVAVHFERLSTDPVNVLLDKDITQKSSHKKRIIIYHALYTTVHVQITETSKFQ